MSEILEAWEQYYAGKITRNEADKLIRGEKPEATKHIPGRYKCKTADNAWTIDYEGLTSSTYRCLEYHKYVQQCGVICKTKEEAEFIQRQQKAYLTLVDKIHELNDGEPDWEYDSEKKWFFYYNRRCGKIELDWYTEEQHFKNELYFQSEEIGKQIIAELGEPLIKLALWGIE